MAAAKRGSPARPATKRAAPRKAASTSKSKSAPRKSAPRKTPAKPVAKRHVDARPSTAPLDPINVLAAVEEFIRGSELTGQAKVKAEIARKLATALNEADPPTAPALARELQTALVGILPKDAEEHDDWTTRLGATADRDTSGS